MNTETINVKKTLIQHILDFYDFYKSIKLGHKLLLTALFIAGGFFFTPYVLKSGIIDAYEALRASGEPARVLVDFNDLVFETALSTSVPLLLGWAFLLYMHSLGSFTEEQMSFVGKGLGFCKSGLQMFCLTYGAVMLGAFASLASGAGKVGLSLGISLFMCLAIVSIGLVLQKLKFDLELPNESDKEKKLIRIKSKFLILCAISVILYIKVVVWCVDVYTLLQNQDKWLGSTKSQVSEFICDPKSSVQTEQVQ